MAASRAAAGAGASVEPAAGRRAVAGGRLSAELARYYARLYPAAKAGCLEELRRHGCGEDEAEEVFSETLERVMARRDPPAEGFEPAQTVALLKRACRQRLIDERRHRGVLRVLPLLEAGASPDRTREGPVEVAEGRDIAAIGREAISSLPERDRALFMQRHELGLSPDEILRRNPNLTRRTYRKVMQRANARALATFERIAGGERCAEMRGARLRRYVAEEASEEESRLIGAHLRRCRPCGLEVAQMRAHLHEVASGLAVLVEANARSAELPARALGLAVDLGDAAVAATRSVRERLRELAIRAATSLPGPGGEGVVGQIAGVAGAKTASVCAGAVVASCLAAGVLPGVGGVEPGAPERKMPAPPVERRPTPAEPESTRIATPTPSPASRPQRKPATSASAKTDRAKSKPDPASSSSYSATPTVSAEQTGAEVGADADGTGVPLPPVSSSAAGHGGTSSSNGSGRSAEFGL